MRRATSHPATLRLLLVSLAVTFVLAPAHGATLAISGTVKGSDGKPVGAAEVCAVKAPEVKTLSAEDGTFSLAGTISDSPAQPDAATGTPIAAAKTGYMTAQVLSGSLSANDMQFTLYPAIVETTVTLMGNRLSNVHLRYGPDWEKNPFSCIVVFDGPPGIKAEVDQIWADYHPGPSLDADAALELENQFRQRLLFYIDGPLVDDKFIKANNYGGGTLMSVTGTVHEKDGRKYITATEIGPYKGPEYPDRIMGPEQPLVNLPVKPGLVIKLTDELSDTLIYVPPGKFYMGNAIEQYPHWQEGPQHLVTFSKGFYLSDHPITNAEYAAVTGDNTRNPKNYPDDAACNMSCEMFATYVKALEKLNPGMVIRAPSKSEWEYVARSGTSNLSFNYNPGSRYGETCDRTVPVKSKKPNGWGFYGIMFNDGSERSCDTAFFGDHTYIPAVTDPRYPSKECLADPAKDHIHANGGNEGYPVNELLNDNSNVGADLGGEQRNGPGWKLIRQRILVEAQE